MKKSFIRLVSLLLVVLMMTGVLGVVSAQEDDTLNILYWQAVSTPSIQVDPVFWAAQAPGRKQLSSLIYPSSTVPLQSLSTPSQEASSAPAGPGVQVSLTN